MALDSKLTQNINLRANGDQLLQPIKAFGREINKVIKDLHTLTDSFSKGNHKSENELRAQVQLLQRLVGEASTLQNILTSSKNKTLLDQLSDQKLGRSVATASRLSQELGKTKTAADALDVRMGQLNKKFADLNDAGRRVGQRDLAKQLNTQEALRQVQRLESQIRSLDARNKVGGGGSAEAAKVRAELQKAQDVLLSRAQNPRRSNFATEIAQVEQLVLRFRELTRVAEQAGDKIRAVSLKRANQSDPMLLAGLERGASAFRFTQDQARGLNMQALGRDIDGNVARLARLRGGLSKAMEQGRSQAVMDRLNKSWENLTSQISEAIAKKKAFDNLPEQRMRRVNEQLFGDGGAAFGARIGGAALLSTGVFAVIGAIRDGLLFVKQFEDELVKLQAIAGATDVEMRGMASSILEVASNSRYSTIEITQAATQIAQAGFSAQETATVLGDALTLAAASGASPTEAVDTLTGALGAFQLQAGESAQVVETLVAGLNGSKLTIQQMQAALQYAGATANEVGISFQELVSLSALGANAGIRSGSTQGTGLRQLIVDLQTPTENFKHELDSLGLSLADVDVKSKGFADVVKTLTDAGFSAEAAYSSFETRAASYFLSIRGQIETYDDLALSLAQVGAAEEANARSMDSFTAKLQQMTNVLTGLLSKLGAPFLSALRVATDAFTIVLKVVDFLVTGFGKMVGSAEGARLGFSALGGVLIGSLVGPIGAISGLVLGLASAFGAASQKADELTAATNEAESRLSSQIETVNAVDAAIKDLIARETTLSKNKVALQTETLNLTARFKDLNNELVGTAQNYDDVLNAMIRLRGEEARQAAVDATKAGLAAKAEADQSLVDLSRSGRKIRNLSTFDIAGRNDGRVDKAYARIERARGLNLTSLPGAELRRLQTDLGASENDLTRIKDTNSAAQKLLPEFTEFLDTLRKFAAFRAKLDLNNGIIENYNEQAGQPGQQRYRDQVGLERQSQKGRIANKEKSGSGDATLARATAQANNQIAAYREELKKVDPKSARARDLQANIVQREALIGTIKRETDAAGRDRDPTKDRPGARLTADQVAAEVKSRLPQARLTDTTRSAATQAGHDRRAGIKRDPNKAPHVTGSALDMAPLAGMDPMEIVAILEDMGLEVTEAPVRGHPTARFVSPNHGTGRHWHFAWKAKTTRFEGARQQASDQARRELQQLLEQGANTRVNESEARIQKLTKQAQAGSAPVGELTSGMTGALEEYRAARLAAFDQANPTEGLSATLKQLTANNRVALEKEITEKAAGFFAQFYRFVADSADNAFEAAKSAIDRAEQQNIYEAEFAVRAADRDLAVAQNDKNKRNVDDGTLFRLQRNKDQAQIETDQRTVSARRTAETATMGQIQQWEGQVNALPAGEDRDGKVLKVAEAYAALNERMRETDALHQSVNNRAEEFANIPLAQRLRDSVDAWAENSGAMDTWGKTLANQVGPALDMFTDQLATMFTSIVTGTRSVVQALGDFINAFARFVTQLIAKALALMAVKAILAAFGLQLEPDASGAGPTMGKKPKKFDGGLVQPERDLPGMFGGGRVMGGVSNRDSADYSLARDEYVVRNKSVRELGIPFMDAINEHGSKGLAKMGAAGSAFTNVQAPRQETNVYVVQEKSKPAMGPNDILVTIQEDILQNGPTKKLIKQVAQGA